MHLDHKRLKKNAFKNADVRLGFVKVFFPQRLKLNIKVKTMKRDFQVAI